MKKVFITFATLIVLAIVFSSCNFGKDNYKASKDSNKPYEIVKTENYKHYDDSGRYYFVYLPDENSTREEIESYYDDITKNDHYDIHTVWFYFDRNDAVNDTDGKLAKVIMEQYSSGIDPLYSWRD